MSEINLTGIDGARNVTTTALNRALEQVLNEIKQSSIDDPTNQLLSEILLGIADFSRTDWKPLIETKLRLPTTPAAPSEAAPRTEA